MLQGIRDEARFHVDNVHATYSQLHETDPRRGNRVVVDTLTEPVKVRRVQILVNTAPEIEFAAHDATIGNLTRGVLERIFFVKEGGAYVTVPQPEDGAFDRLDKWITQLLKYVPPTTPYTREQFLNTYVGRKYTRYANAYHNLDVTGGLRPKHAYTSEFTKCEKTNRTAKPDGAPRVINPRSYEYNAEVGRYIKAVEKKLYRGIAEIYGDVTVMKGLNADQVGTAFAEKWAQFDDPVAIGADAKRFDQHCSVPGLKKEHSVYNRIYSDKYLAWMLRQQLKRRGFGRCRDGVIKLWVAGGRCSGDMNTGLGNCVLMCLMVLEVMETLGIRHLLANNGDDCVIIMERADLDRMEAFTAEFLKFGYTMVLEDPVDQLELVEFCQARPIQVRQGEWRMVRNLDSLAKDLVSVKPCENQEQWDVARKSISDCGLSLAGDVAVVGAFYRMLQRGAETANTHSYHANDSEVTGMQILARGVHAGREVDDVCRVSMWRAFGLTPDRQCAMEEEYDRVTPTFTVEPQVFRPSLTVQ